MNNKGLVQFNGFPMSALFTTRTMERKNVRSEFELGTVKEKWSFRCGISAVFGEYFGPRTTRASAHVWNVGLDPIHKTIISLHRSFFFNFLIKIYNSNN